MTLPSVPDSLRCAECGDEIDDAGYLPAIEHDDGYSPLTEAAVCNDCGFTEVGFDGCAPDLDDLIDPDPEHVLLQIRSTDEGIEPIK